MVVSRVKILSVSNSSPGHFIRWNVT